MQNAYFIYLFLIRDKQKSKQRKKNPMPAKKVCSSEIERLRHDPQNVVQDIPQDQDAGGKVDRTQYTKKKKPKKGNAPAPAPPPAAEHAEASSAPTEKVASSGTSHVVNFRSPICCFLGHIDAGKTSLLDGIRHTHVQAHEAGGMTQQIHTTFLPMESIMDWTKAAGEARERDIRIPTPRRLDPWRPFCTF